MVSDRSARDLIPVPFRVTTRAFGVTRVEVTGEVDMATVDGLVETLDSAVGSPDTVHIEVDLAKVTFLASSGIPALVRAYRSAEQRQITLVVVNCQPLVTKVIELTGGDQLLTPTAHPVPDP